MKKLEQEPVQVDAIQDSDDAQKPQYLIKTY
jgi:hypothetical protein